MTAGAKLAVYAAMQAIADGGDEILLPAPYWTSYGHIIRMAGGVPVVVPGAPENDFKATAKQLAGAVTARTKALVLNNPVNPSGAVYGPRELREIAAVCRERDLYVIADEIYASLVYDGARFSSFASIDGDARRRTVTVNGVSKAYAMTGWRIGYAAGDAAIIAAIHALCSHSSGCPSAIGQAAALEAYAGAGDETERMREAMQKRRDLLCAALGGIGGVDCRVPQGAFYLLLDVRPFLRPGETDTDLAVSLLENAGVAVVPCAEFGLPGYVRLAYSQDEARLAEGARRLQDHLTQRKREHEKN